MDLREINYEVGSWLCTDTNGEFGMGSSTSMSAQLMRRYRPNHRDHEYTRG
jgi:hypothetical protein